MTTASWFGSDRIWVVVITLVVVIYLLTNFVLRPLFGTFGGTYVVQPILWILLAILVLRLPEQRPIGGSSVKKALIATAVVVGVLQIVLYITGGFFSGFGESPYSFTPRGIITNIFYVGSALVGMELSRAYLVNRLAKKHTASGIALVALLYTVLMISIARFGRISGGEEAINFLGTDWLPLLARNLLASFLAFIGGPLPAIAYTGTFLAFQWFSPVLPDLPTMTTALVGTIAPIVGFLFVQHGLLPSYTRIRRKRGEKTTLPLGWLVTGVFSVAIIWFSVGLLNIWPTVIYSGSMRPALDVGDMVIIADIQPESINVGDVISYRSGEDTIVHRVVDIVVEEDRRGFVTQGDANDSPDSNPVWSGQLTGKVFLTVPKVGWVSVAIKDWLFSGE